MSSVPPRLWAQIDNDNPRIWDLFVKFTRELIGRGFEHHSAYAVMHRVRWETAEVISEPDPGGNQFKISNQWTSYYARKFHLTYPQYDGFFITKPAEADRVMGTTPRLRPPRSKPKLLPW